MHNTRNDTSIKGHRKRGRTDRRHRVAGGGETGEIVEVSS